MAGINKRVGEIGEESIHTGRNNTSIHMCKGHAVVYILLTSWFYPVLIKNARAGSNCFWSSLISHCFCFVILDSEKKIANSSLSSEFSFRIILSIWMFYNVV